MAARTGSATWTGDLSGGSGRLVVGPSRWEADYSFRSRFADDAVGATNPEELLAAAHAGPETCGQWGARHGGAGRNGVAERTQNAALSPLLHHDSGNGIVIEYRDDRSPPASDQSSSS